MADRTSEGSVPAPPPLPKSRSPDASRRSQRARQAILEASLELVGEVGYTRLTIEAIAARARVGKQTIYRWWPSKAAVLLDAFTALVEQPDYGGALPDTGDLAADLRYVMRATVDEFNDPAFEAPYRAVAIAGAEDPELSAMFVRQLSEPGLLPYIDRLHAAQRAGQLRADVDVRLAAEMLLSPFSQRWLTRSAPLSYEFTDALVDLVLCGLSPRG